MISTTPPNVSALDKRMQAMALLREATDLDGLSAYAVHHRHEHGGSSYVLWSKKQPNEAEAQSVLDVPFEPDRGEDLAVDSLTLEELVGISGVSQSEEGHSTVTPGTWVSTLGHPVDPREVAEWVGLHHRAHLDSQPQRLQEWIDRFVEAHPDRFTTYLVSDRWVHSFAGRETITRWVYRIDGDYEGLNLGQRQEPTGQWISLNGEARQDLESSLRDNDIPATNNLPAHWGDQVRCTTQLPDWAMEPPLQSSAQAAPAAPVTESLRLAGLTLIGLAEHDQHCGVFDLGEDGKHCACTCGFDDAIRTIEAADKAAQAAPAAPVTESLRLAGLTLIGLAEHDQHCGVLDLDEEGKHCACTCGFDDAIRTIRATDKAAQALMELNRHPGLDPSVAAPLDLLLGRQPEGDATVSAWKQLVQALNAEAASPECRNLGAVLERCTHVAHLIYTDEEWRMSLDPEIEDLAIDTVVGTECVRLYLQVERLLDSLCDVDYAPKGELRRAAAMQMSVLLNG